MNTKNLPSENYEILFKYRYESGQGDYSGGLTLSYNSTPIINNQTGYIKEFKVMGYQKLVDILFYQLSDITTNYINDVQLSDYGIDIDSGLIFRKDYSGPNALIATD